MTEEEERGEPKFGPSSPWSTPPVHRSGAPAPSGPPPAQPSPPSPAGRSAPAWAGSVHPPGPQVDNTHLDDADLDDADLDDDAAYRDPPGYGQPPTHGYDHDSPYGRNMFHTPPASSGYGQPPVSEPGYGQSPRLPYGVADTGVDAGAPAWYAPPGDDLRAPADPGYASAPNGPTPGGPAPTDEWAGGSTVARRGPSGLVRLRTGRPERDDRIALAAVRRTFGGLRQVTVVSPDGDPMGTVATLLLGLTFGQARGGSVLAWDNGGGEGALGLRARTDWHARTVYDLLRDLDRFAYGGRVDELTPYLRSQQDAMFDVLAADGPAAGTGLTARAFREVRGVVGRFYPLLLVDAGGDVRAERWRAALDSSDQLVVTVSASHESAEAAARLLDRLENSDRSELGRRAVVVLAMPSRRQQAMPRTVERHFAARCRRVLRVPYERQVDTGAPLRFGAISPESRRAWLQVAAAAAEGL